MAAVDPYDADLPGPYDEVDAYLNALEMNDVKKARRDELRRAYALSRALSVRIPPDHVLKLAGDIEEYLKTGRPHGLSLTVLPLRG